MASDNLNRAFIKAYGRGAQPNLAPPPNVKMPAPVPVPHAIGGSDAYIMRFDTATVQSIVPQMHQRPPHQGSATVAPVHAPQPLVTHRTQAAEIPPPRYIQSTSDALPAGAHLATIHSTVVEPRPLELANSIDLASFLNGATLLVPSASLNSISPQSQSVPNTPARDAGSPEFGTSDAGRIDMAQPPLQTNNQSKTTRFSSEPTRFQGQSIDLESMELSGVEGRVARRNKGSEIFRLDRPSYSAGACQTDDVYVDDELSSPSVVVDDINTDVAEEAPIGNERQFVQQQAKHHGQALARERNLREARSRIFNPLWEVDRLEWPRVCVELLNAIDSPSNGVAKNLLGACQEGLQVLAVTSPQSGSGASTVACCLAMLAGRHGLNIALVDGNTENPSLCYQTNLDLEVDWHEALASQLPLEEIAVHSVDDQVTLIPLLARLNAPQLNEQNMAMMLRELSQSFDLVIVDLGHMDSPRNMVETLGDLGALNAVITVVDCRSENAERVDSCLRQIRQTGITSVGLVENFAA